MGDHLPRGSYPKPTPPDGDHSEDDHATCSSKVDLNHCQELEDCHQWQDCPDGEQDMEKYFRKGLISEANYNGWKKSHKAVQKRGREGHASHDGSTKVHAHAEEKHDHVGNPCDGDNNGSESHENPNCGHEPKSLWEKTKDNYSGLRDYVKAKWGSFWNSTPKSTNPCDHDGNGSESHEDPKCGHEPKKPLTLQEAARRFAAKKTARFNKSHGHHGHSHKKRRLNGVSPAIGDLAQRIANDELPLEF